VLMQNGQPVSYSRRALTTSERNYSQVENELLAQIEKELLINLSNL